jgi:putative selenate reductase
VQKSFSVNIANEAQRCLGCNLICNKCVEVCPNRANVSIFTGSDSSFKDKFQILHLDALCNECGNCETFCPHAGAPYKDKLTYFGSEVEFLESRNNGFFFFETGDTEYVTFRVNNFSDTIKVNEVKKYKTVSPDVVSTLYLILNVRHNYNYLTYKD